MELKGFATTQEELAATADRLREARGTSDRRICVCGHPVARHVEYAGRVSCAPTRMTCPCLRVVPVIEVSDTRPFLRKTQGPGAEHALMQGLQGLVAKGRTWQWLKGFPICVKCRSEKVAVLPFALDARGRVSIEPEGENVLLCMECLDELKQQVSFKAVP